MTYRRKRNWVRKTDVLFVRAKPAEIARFKAAAEMEGLTMSEWVRQGLDYLIQWNIALVYLGKQPGTKAHCNKIVERLSAFQND